VQGCVRDAYCAVNPFARSGCPPRQRRRRFGRSLAARLQANAMNRAMTLMKTCVMTNLSLTADNELSQSGADALIDAMTAPDAFKQHKKDLVKLCIDETPAELTGAARLEFQLTCVGEMNGMDCALGVANKTSPTVAFAVAESAGECMKDLKPNTPRPVVANAACTLESVTALLNSALDRTSATAGRRRRDASEDGKMKLLAMLVESDGLTKLERVLGASPPPQPCRRRWGRPACPPQTPGPEPLTLDQVDAVLGNATEYLGPLDELFASVPARAGNVTECTLQRMSLLQADGSVDVEGMKATVAEWNGEDGLKELATGIMDYCQEQGKTGNAQEFHMCCSMSAAYGCRLYEMKNGDEEEG